jgi:ribosomal protein L22
MAEGRKRKTETARSEGTKAEGARKAPAPKPAAKKSAGTGKKAEAAKAAPKRKPASKAAPKPRSKPATRRRAKAKEPLRPVVRARARYLRVAPRKARLVADQIRGLGIEEARALLDFSPRSAARDLRKLLDSAAANAENNHELVADDLRVAEVRVDEGPTLRRYRARALGRATRIDKRTSHVSLALTSPEED